MLKLFFFNEVGGLISVLAKLTYIAALGTLITVSWQAALAVFIFGLVLHIWGAYLQYVSARTVTIRRGR